MSRTLVISPAAQEDYGTIWRYSAARRDEARADTYLDAIDEAVKRIAAQPIGSSRCDHIGPGYVRRPAGSPFVFAIFDEQRDHRARITQANEFRPPSR